MEAEQFQVFIRLNDLSDLAYPYIAVDFISCRVISFSDTMADISTYTGREMELIQSDYLATSNFLQVDMDAIEELVYNFVRPEPFNLIAWLDGSGECIVKFKSLSGIEEMIIPGPGEDSRPKIASASLINELLMLREQVYNID